MKHKLPLFLEIIFKSTTTRWFENISISNVYAKGIRFENVSLICEKEDYRTAVVLDDVKNARLKALKIEEPAKDKESIYAHHSQNILMED